MRFQVVVLLAVLLSACAAPINVPQIGSSSDGRPANSVDVSKIPNAQPAPVVRTRAGNAPQYTVLGKTYRVLPDSYGYQKRGEASWYGTKFHGRRTANGEVYNMFGMTAAHKTLPIPSYVRVTHVGNGRSIIVRINDRGPFHGNRIIDLSYAAAKKLGVIATGVALVDVVDVTPSARGSSVTSRSNETKSLREPAQLVPDIVSPRAKNEIYLQLGAFQQQQSAEALRSKASTVATQSVDVVTGSDNLHRVFVGPISSPQEVLRVQYLLRQKGLSEGHIAQSSTRNN